MTPLFAMLVVTALFLGPLGWRTWLDRRQARADGIGADIRAAVNRRLRGESVLSLQVAPSLLGRTGRIEVSVPSGYEWVIETAWPEVVGHAPAGYDVVLKARDVQHGRLSGEVAPALPRAA
jgi:hypothetical protein